MTGERSFSDQAHRCCSPDETPDQREAFFVEQWPVYS